MKTANIEELRKVIAFSELPDDHLQWILDHSTYEEIQDGQLVAKYGDPADHMWVLVEGKVTFYMNVNGRQVYFFTFENNKSNGGVGGLMPYSRMKTIPGYAYATGPTRVLRLHKDHFTELEHLNPDLIQKLIGYMTERAKSFATTKLEHEKVNALGSLAAGIAHELNNPAAAINRIASELQRRLDLNYELTEELVKSKVTSEHIQGIQEMIAEIESRASERKKLTAMQRMNNEDAMEDWLLRNGVNNRQAAETFSEFGITTGEFEHILHNIGKDAIIHLVPWLENLISSQRILEDLADASGRISTLVGAIKSHVQMDRGSDKHPTDIHKDIDNTLTLLGFKLREKNIELKKIFFNAMPPVSAYVGELNQVWTNLIDNAIYAMPQNGRLAIETGYDGLNAYVNIIDSGSGIPEEILSRIFDPFFTTKKVGEGTGIGLDIVNRIIRHHNGEIRVQSEPGRTVFTVRIPINDNSTSNQMTIKPQVK